MHAKTAVVTINMQLTHNRSLEELGTGEFRVVTRGKWKSSAHKEVDNAQTMPWAVILFNSPRALSLVSLCFDHITVIMFHHYCQQLY